MSAPVVSPLAPLGARYGVCLEGLRDMDAAALRGALDGLDGWRAERALSVKEQARWDRVVDRVIEAYQVRLDRDEVAASV